MPGNERVGQASLALEHAEKESNMAAWLLDVICVIATLVTFVLFIAFTEGCENL